MKQGSYSIDTQLCYKAFLFKLKVVTVSQPCSWVRWAKSPTSRTWKLQLENLGGKSEPALDGGIM